MATPTLYRKVKREINENSRVGAGFYIILQLHVSPNPRSGPVSQGRIQEFGKGVRTPHVSAQDVKPSLEKLEVEV